VQEDSQSLYIIIFPIYCLFVYHFQKQNKIYITTVKIDCVSQYYYI